MNGNYGMIAVAVPGSRIFQGLGRLYLPTSVKQVVCPKTFTIKVNGGEKYCGYGTMPMPFKREKAGN
jgi:hypothetical protein